jgi:hypothetical protein
MSRAITGDPEAGAAAEDHGRLGRGWLGSDVGEIGLERGVDLAGDVALQTAHDLALGLAFLDASFGVIAGALAVAQPAHGDHMKGAVCLPVTAGVQTVADRFA